MTTNEIVGRLKAGGLDASSTNRGAAVYVTEARAGRAEPGWFGFRIVCDSEATERRVRAILSSWYDIDAGGNVWRLRAKNRVPLMAIKRGGVPPTPPTPTGNYLYLEAKQANSTISMISNLETAPNIEYSTDGVNFQEWQHTTADSVHTFDTITLSAVGDKVYLKGVNSALSDQNNSGKRTGFVMTGNIKAGGSVQSLVDSKGDSTTAIPMSCLFNVNAVAYGQNTALTEVEEGLLPATTLTYECYMWLFSACVNLVNFPTLPAANASDYCYYGMCDSCSSLSSKIIIKTSPNAELCFQEMLYGCGNVTDIEINATMWDTNNTSSWVNGVSQSGTFTKLTSTTIPNGENGIPDGWNVVNE